MNLPEFFPVYYNDLPVPERLGCQGRLLCNPTEAFTFQCTQNDPDYPRVNYEQQQTIEMDLRCKYSFHLKCAGQWPNCVNKSERIDTDNIRDVEEACLALGESCTGFAYSADAKYGYLKDCGSNHLNSYFHLDIDESGVKKPPRMTDARDLIITKVFLASAAIGDHRAFSLWRVAKQSCIIEKEEVLFVEAAERFFDSISEVHPHAKQQLSFFKYDIGVVYEALASRMMKRHGPEYEEGAHDALINAALAYKEAGELTHQFYPSLGLRSIRYTRLGITLKRLGEDELPIRAFIWALTDPFAYNEVSRVDIANCLTRIWERKFWTQAERGKPDKGDLKYQKEHVSTTCKGTHYRITCTKCQARMHEWQESCCRCARCFAPYCSEECQIDDFSQHKPDCKKFKEEAITFPLRLGAYFQCPDSTRTMLEQLCGGRSQPCSTFTMSLAVWFSAVEKFKAAREVDPTPVRSCFLEISHQTVMLMNNL